MAAVTSSAPNPASESEPALEQTLTYRLHSINKLSDRESQRAYMQEFGLTLGEGRCVATIGRFAPLSVKDLARAANLDKGTASRAAQVLVDRGLASKTVSEVDGRGIVLDLTARGRAVYRQVIAMIARRNREIFSCLSEAERAALGHMLDRVAARLRGDVAG